MAIDNETLVFVEVKTRDSKIYEDFSPSDAVNIIKRTKLQRLADEFQYKFAKQIRRKRIRKMRFDIAAVKRTSGYFFDTFEISHQKAAW